MSDPYDLQRFINAQEHVYLTVCDELRQGRKQTHWMWFVFPQIAGLGHSEMAKRFAMSSIDEARAYLKHPLLGARLLECAGLVLEVSGRSAEEIFGYPDFLKFCSSMTLFSQVAAKGGVFDQCLQKYFRGVPDAATLRLI